MTCAAFKFFDLTLFVFGVLWQFHINLVIRPQRLCHLDLWDPTTSMFSPLCRIVQHHCLGQWLMDCLTAFSRDFLVTSSLTTSSFFFVNLLRAWSWVTIVISQPFTWDKKVIRLRNILAHLIKTTTFVYRQQYDHRSSCSDLFCEHLVPSGGLRPILHHSTYLQNFVSHHQASDICWSAWCYPGHIDTLKTTQVQ